VVERKTDCERHLRSLFGAEIRCIELLGERVMLQDLDSQVAALQIRAGLLKRIMAL
jgi:hypothetical protein